MRKRRRWLLIVAGPAIVLLAFAYQLIAPRSHLLFPPRASNGTEYVLYAHVPQQCRNGGCPALYLLDGERWIPSFSKWDDALAADGDISPVVIVGIGYRDIFHTTSRRKFDFTPAFGRTPGETGGAEAYLRVLREEIIPYAEAHLPIATQSRAIAGHSYAGLFATYALMSAPDLFDGYIVMSPALWFDDGKIFDAPFAESEAAHFVFLAADMPGTERGAMANDVIRLNQALLARPNITVSRSLLPNTTHDNMVDPSARGGLEALYRPAPSVSP